ncbi:MAG: preprotein translocase subunit SecA [candidate division KSB1 bacterium]|nr:preprotein translocase subunit SecA [candidate division KSB1 bacterium]MDZ7275105.1 preprotein translocase subunit SecA [candidate division KSB1 bacterium]MDZ7286447.1 preprotein translocase subunit SecA [candidate division KSB1 bacterium]MDZ7299389.1 preprotein translocase subunit SecA [candidate division KSB1 bacterium]MDZ7307833.1 preprotein translocase subunit SecA [candidate division KSB1 bacterium]
MNLLTKLFGNKHERDIKRLQPIVAEINRIYATLHDLSDDALRAKTQAFRQRLQEATQEVAAEIAQLQALLRGEDSPAANGKEGASEHGYRTMEEIRDRLAEAEEEERELLRETLDELLPEAYAVVKETCRRLCGKSWKVVGQETEWNMVPFDVQLIGGIVLHQGKIAEMATGEGKTLVATMPLYLNALAGKGVHLVTVNDYLAQRDCEWMGEIFKFLGLKAAYITNQMNAPQRQEAYRADITYGTNNEFGFDYLRDNMAIRPEDQVQRGHYFAIVDEVDSVLIDEARTPLIISGQVEHAGNEQYAAMKPRVERLVQAQNQLVTQLVSEAEKLLATGDKKDEYEAGIRLLRAERGAPKNKRFMKALQETGVKKLIRQVESDFLRDKRMHEIDEELFYAIDEKQHTIDLTEKGREFLSPNEPEMFVLPDLGERIHEINQREDLTVAQKEEAKAKLQEEYATKSERVHSISQLLRAYSLYERDVEYVVNDGKVIIVDEFTGRLMPGRRYSDGLHQAIEAKEGVRVGEETQTLATITLQNYFRMYHKLAGMTGTAETEAAEFYEIYKLDVVVIPTNERVRRIDYEDQIYKTRREKYNAVINEIAELYAKRRPVLVGTISVEVSETLSRMLKRRGIPHQVLNAKYHEQEANIVKRAGEPGAVTIATNMAGRGTDIKLGRGVVAHPNCALVQPKPNQEPCPLLAEYKCHENVPCGLHIIGTERHESRRIDRQLRGRSGRQGDPGSSRFYLSLEDDLMRLFGSERIAAVMDRLGVQEGEVITHRMVTRSIERAQKRVEAHNFSIRKHLLEYDDVMNQQREVVYDRRGNALRGENLREEILDIIRSYVSDKVALYATGDHAEDWDWESLQNAMQKTFLTAIPAELRSQPGLGREELGAALTRLAVEAYERKEAMLTPKLMRQLERFAMLRAIDEKWREHLYEMDQLKEGIGLRAYGQKDPLIEYKSEGFRMFKEMLAAIDEQVLEFIIKAQVAEPPPLRRRMPPRMTTVHHATEGMGFASRAGTPPAAQAAGKPQPIVVEQKVGRNDPCPCGSGKKYKKCHGAQV